MLEAYSSLLDGISFVYIFHPVHGLHRSQRWGQLEEMLKHFSYYQI